MICAIEIQQHPGEAAKGSTQIRVHDGVDALQTWGHASQAVETQPTKPEQHGANGYHGNVVRTEVDHEVFLSWAQEIGDDKSRESRQDFDGATTGVVQNAPFVGPTVGVPYPARYGTVDQSHPAKGEGYEGQYTATFTNCANVNARSDGGKHALEIGKRHFWDDDDACVVVGNAAGDLVVCLQVLVAEVVQVSYEFVCSC